MGKNNSRARREWRRDRAVARQQPEYRPRTYWDDERKGWWHTNIGIADALDIIESSIRTYAKQRDRVVESVKVFNQFTNIDDKHSEIIREIYNG